MTTGENANRIRDQIERLRSVNLPFELAVRSVEAMKVERIFERGENTAGQTFSYNTTDEIYVTDEQAPKAVNHTGKTGKKIRSGYYKSYADFRQAMGRETSHVNYRLTNDLQIDYSNSTGVPSPTRVDQFTYTMGLNRIKNAEKRRGLEKKYGVIFDTNQNELRELQRIIEFELAANA